MTQPLILKFSFTNEDLQTAYDAKLDHVCKPVIRYILIALGCLAILGPIISLLGRHNTGFGFIDVILLIIGAVILRAWALAPILKRRRIRMESGASKMIRIIIDENTLIEESGDTPKDVRKWDHVIRMVEMPKGFLIYFHDGQIWWLPTRTFKNIQERDDLMNLAAEKGKL